MTGLNNEHYHFHLVAVGYVLSYIASVHALDMPYLITNFVHLLVQKTLHLRNLFHAKYPTAEMTDNLVTKLRGTAFWIIS